MDTRLYRRVMGPMIHRPMLGIGFLAGITLLLIAACGLVATGLVKVKMLPYDNKSELQVIIDMDEGTTLERTLRAAPGPRRTDTHRARGARLPDLCRHRVPL